MLCIYLISHDTEYDTCSQALQAPKTENLFFPITIILLLFRQVIVHTKLSSLKFRLKQAKEHNQLPD